MSISPSSVLFINNPSLTQSSPVHHIGCGLGLASRFWFLSHSFVFAVEERERAVVGGFGLVKFDSMWCHAIAFGDFDSFSLTVRSLIRLVQVGNRFSRGMEERSPAANWIPPCINWIGGRGEPLLCFPLRSHLRDSTTRKFYLFIYFNLCLSDPKRF